MIMAMNDKHSGFNKDFKELVKRLLWRTTHSSRLSSIGVCGKNL